MNDIARQEHGTIEYIGQCVWLAQLSRIGLVNSRKAFSV